MENYFLSFVVCFARSYRIKKACYLTDNTPILKVILLWVWCKKVVCVLVDVTVILQLATDVVCKT